jgi:hypothetical protein
MKITILWQLKVDDISFDNTDAPSKIQCDVQLEAFDAEGNVHRFVPQSHVSNLMYYNWNSTNF